MKKKVPFVAFIFALVIFMGSYSCVMGINQNNDLKDPSPQQAVKLDYGTVNGSSYTNNYFNLTLTIPDQWQVQNQEVINNLKEKGKAALAGKNDNLKATLDASDIDTLILIAMFKYPLGSAVSYNPSMACVAEKVSLYPGIKRGSDYLFNSKKLMENSQIQYQFDQDIYSETVNGTVFDVLEVKIDLGKMVITQNYYSAILKGYALSFIISYTTDEEKDSLLKIINSIKIGG